MRARVWVLALLALVALGCAACGGGSSAPRLLSLELAPARPLFPGERLGVQARYEDDDGDLGGGRAEVTLLRTGESRGVVLELPLPALASGPTGSLDAMVTLPDGLPAARYELGLVAIDRAKRRSAPLSAGFEVLAPP